MGCDAQSGFAPSDALFKAAGRNHQVVYI